jgi:hypothetical protein
VSGESHSEDTQSILSEREDRFTIVCNKYSHFKEDMGTHIVRIVLCSCCYSCE